MGTPLEDFHAACVSILTAGDTRALDYARGYARAGCYMTDPEGCRVQALYIVSNITGWRGDLAKEVRDRLKALGKQETWK